MKNDTGNYCEIRIDGKAGDPFNPLPAGETMRSGEGTLSYNYRVYVKEHITGSTVRKHYRRCYNAMADGYTTEYSVRDDFGQERLEEF